MIYSNKYKFLYIEIPKTGTTFTETLLLQNIYKINRSEVFVRNSIANDGFTAHEYEKRHIKLYDLKNELTCFPRTEKENKVLNNLFKFCMIRNPYDIVVSWFSYLTQQMGDIESTIKQYGDKWYTDDFDIFVNNAPPFVFGNQYMYMIDNWGQFKMDYVGRYENFEEDITFIMNKIFGKSNWIGDFEPINKSNHKDYRIYYTDNIKKIISEKFRVDLYYLKYKY